MLNSGWLREVAEIVEAGYSDSVRAFTAIGYRFLLQVLEGTMTVDEARDEIVRQTQKYAKRQMTWFRREHDVVWVDCPYEWSSIKKRVERFVGGDI